MFLNQGIILIFKNYFHDFKHIAGSFFKHMYTIMFLNKVFCNLFFNVFEKF